MRPAAAQEALTVGAQVMFYGDNTEFSNPFREGETIFGAAARLDGQVRISETARLTLGVFGNQRFGSDASFEQVRPILSLTLAGRRSTVVFGTLPPRQAEAAPGPDRGGPHGLLPPVQRETLAFDRPYEAGLQWSFAGQRLEQHAWLQWQRLNTARQRERFDAGVRGALQIRGPFSLPYQAHIVHEGGQLFATGVVRDSLAVVSGLAVSNARRLPASSPARGLFSLELLGLWSHDTPDRQAPTRTSDGAGFFGRFAAEHRGWRAHLIAWRGTRFVKDEGDANYLSVQRDGGRYRGVRDYAETGLTRTIRLAPAAVFEASFRLHRIERHYEYSYRLLAVVAARAWVRPRSQAALSESAVAVGRTQYLNTTPTEPVQ